MFVAMQVEAECNKRNDNKKKSIHTGFLHSTEDIAKLYYIKQ